MASNNITYNNNNNWTVPQRLDGNVTVEVWGAGGGGGANNRTGNNATGGGGGGAYATSSVSATKGAVLAVVIGFRRLLS